MKMTVNFYIDTWISEDGIHLFTETQEGVAEEIITFFRLANEFIESQCVPTEPPTIRQDGRGEIAKLAYKLEATAAYLRNQGLQIQSWEDKHGKDHMGHRD